MLNNRLSGSSYIRTRANSTDLPVLGRCPLPNSHWPNPWSRHDHLLPVFKAVVQLRYMLFVAGYAPSSNSDNVEEVVIEGLCLALLVGRMAPFSGEFGGTMTDLIPR